jgi:hypothetical protein
MGGGDLKGYASSFSSKKCRSNDEIYCGCSGQSWDDEGVKRKCSCGTTLNIYNKTDKCCSCSKKESE